MTLPPNDVVFNFSTDATDTEATSIDSVFDNNYDATFVEQLAVFLNVYYTPVLIVLGCVGNLISIIVFYKSKLRVQSISLYLSALALSDTLFLLQLLPPWLNLLDASSFYSRNGFCQLFVYLSYVTCSYSSWLVAAITFERFVAVMYPLRSDTMSKRARLVIGSLAMSALLVNVPVLRFAMPGGDYCIIDELMMEYAALFNVFDTVFSFTMPLVVIVVLNACIVWRVYRENRARAHLVSHQRSGSQQRITRMLLIVSSVFVLLNMPAYTLRIIVYADTIDEHEDILAVLQQVSVALFSTNFAINFVLYCMTGQNFRRALRETFPWLRWRCEPASVALRGHAAGRPARSSSVLEGDLTEQATKDEPSAGVESVRHEPSKDVELGVMRKA